MLDRLLEPEVMDSQADAADYDAMDHREVNRVFVQDFLQAVGQAGPELAGGEMLDLGAGTAQIPIALCRASNAARVLAIDLAESMLALARQNVFNAGLAERIRLQQADAKRLPFGDGHFAAVISNSIVHHIPEPAGVLAEAVRVVARGGRIFMRDLARPQSEQQLAHLVDTYAADCNLHQRQLFAESLHAALTLEEIRALVDRLGYPPQDVEATSDRHWTWSTQAKR